MVPTMKDTTIVELLLIFDKFLKNKISDVIQIKMAIVNIL